MAQGIGNSQARMHSEMVLDKRQHIADVGLSMGINDMVVEVTLTDANDSAVVLPSVSEAVGGIYVIRLVAVGTGAVALTGGRSRHDRFRSGRGRSASGGLPGRRRAPGNGATAFGRAVLPAGP